jgi:hypothetical protein
MKFKFLILLSICILIATLLASASEPLTVTWTTGADTSTPTAGTTGSAIIKVPFPGFEGEAPISTTSKECQECKTILQCLACIDKMFVEAIFGAK